jgi:hypothetical protein
MNAYHASRGFAASSQPAALRDRRLPFAVAQSAEPLENTHNARGLVIAVLMSAACWAGVGIAFLI